MLKVKKLSTIIGVVAVTCALAACGGGGSSTVSAGTYVKSICQAVGPFEKNVQARSSALNLSTLTSPAQGKTALQGFLNAIASDTDKAVSKLKAAGTPDVANGKQISSAIVGAFTQLHSALGTAVNSANQLPTSSPTAFKNAAVSLGNTVRTSMSGIGSSLSGLKSAQLEAAAKKEPACQNLGA
jgi:hypothetical protein